MTRKQIKKHAAQILAWEKIRSNPESTKQQKYDAEQNITQLTAMIMGLPHNQGLAILADIDDIIQHQLEQEKSLEKQGD